MSLLPCINHIMLLCVEILLYSSASSFLDGGAKSMTELDQAQKRILTSTYHLYLENDYKIQGYHRFERYPTSLVAKPEAVAHKNRRTV